MINAIPVQSIEDVMTEIIHTVHSTDVAGASMSAAHPDKLGVMMLFYFHPDASPEDMHNLLHAELQRTLDHMGDNDPVPPRDPRFFQ